MHKFSITNRYALKIVGYVLIPEKSKGLVFVMHGLSAYKEETQIETMANTFFNNGYTVVNFDATNSFGESEGKFENATMKAHYEDLVDVVSWAQNQSWYVEPFVLAGSSFGGYAVLQYAEEYPSKVKAIFPHAAVISGKLSFEGTRKFKPGKLEEWEKTGWHVEISKSRPGIIKKLPWSHMEERLNHDLIPGATNLTMPILFMVGENDFSKIEDQKVLYNAIPEKTKREFHLIKGAPHTFEDPEHLMQLANILDAWIKKLK